MTNEKSFCPPINNAVRAMLQAAQDRAAAEQRWRDERERERLRDLLGLGRKVTRPEAEEKPAPVKRCKRRPTIDGALKQATKAGVAVSGATISADGSVTLAFGKASASPVDGRNEWDEVYGPH